MEAEAEAEEREGEARPFVEESRVLPSVELTWKSNFSPELSLAFSLSSLPTLSSCRPNFQTNKHTYIHTRMYIVHTCIHDSICKYFAVHSTLKQPTG